MIYPIIPPQRHVNNSFNYKNRFNSQPNFTGLPSIIWQGMKNEIKMNLFFLNPLNLKKLFSDPEPFNYIIFNELIPNKEKYLLSTTKLTNINVPLRYSHSQKSLCLYRKEYSDGSKTLALKNNFSLLDLAFLEYNEKENGKLTINFLTNVVGRNKYRRLEQILTQALAEDYINHGILPEFHAKASPVGNINISRTMLYKKMGADIFTPSETPGNNVIVNKQRVLELITEKINKGKQIFPDTNINIAYAK